jgi:hypothetical protein
MSGIITGHVLQYRTRLLFLADVSESIPDILESLIIRVSKLLVCIAVKRLFPELCDDHYP